MIRLLFIVSFCYLFSTAVQGQCTGGAVWNGSIPANGALTGTATLQGGATVSVITAGTGYQSGYPQYANPLLTYNGIQFRMLRIIRRGPQFGNQSRTTFDFSEPLDSNMIQFRVRGIRNDGFNVETQEVLGFNNGIAVSASYLDPINDAYGSGNFIYGPTNSNSGYEGDIRIHFNDKVDCVIVRKAALDDFVDINLYARCVVLLPFVLSDFSLTRIANSARLNWSTSEAFNFDHFVVEKSTDATYWTPLGYVGLNGNGKNQYSFTDTSLQPGKNFYRLKTIDHDGLMTYSRIIYCNNYFSGTDLVRVVENPFDNEINMISKSDAPLSINIFVQDGRLMGIYRIVKGANRINTSSWKQGLYYISIRKPDGRTQNIRLLRK